MLAQYAAGGDPQISCVKRKSEAFFYIRKHTKRFFGLVVEQPSFFRKLDAL